MSALRSSIVVIVLLAAGAAHAQQQPDAATLQRLLAAIEAQRNQALTQHAYAEAARAGLAEDLAKAQARIKELEAQKPTAPPKETP